MLSEVAGVTGSVKERTRRAARLLGWEYSRTKSLWYGEARRIDADEWIEAQAYLDARTKKEAQNELSRFREATEARFARIEAALALPDED